MRNFDFVIPQHQKESMMNILPRRSSVGSAAYDFYAPVDAVVKHGESFTFWTNVKAHMNDDEVLLIFPRSSMGIKGWRLKNTVGVIDASYADNPSNDGNIGICLEYCGEGEACVCAGDRIAQGIFMKYLITDDDVTNETRTGGFGSSGK
jgi:dUTP pyrophosphatase